MTSPPRLVDPPEIYLVELTTWASMPRLWASNSVKGMRVVSAMSGTPFSWAISAMTERSATSIWGLVIISRKTHAVFSSIAPLTASRSSRLVSRVSMPKGPRVLRIRLTVLPKRWLLVTIFLPALTKHSSTLVMAAMPELKANTFCAPVSDFTLFSKNVTVGFITRTYSGSFTLPVKASVMCFAVSNSKAQQ